MRAAEHESIDVGFFEGREVLLGHFEQLGSAGDARLNELDESWASLGEDLEIGCRDERIVVGTRINGAECADNTDALGAGLPHCRAYGGVDDLDYGYAPGSGVALARIPEHRG